MYFINIVFFDEHNLINRQKKQQHIEQLEMQKQSYLDKIEADKETISLIKDTANNSAFLEKYAREHYFFKKIDEDIFVIK